MILLWPEGKLLARIANLLSQLSLQYSESSFSLQWPLFWARYCMSSFLIKLLLIQQSKLECACAVVYFIDSLLFSVHNFVRICKVSD